MTIELRKVMAIVEVAATNMSNVPYRITLHETVGLFGEKSTLILDQEAADRLNLPVLIDMVGKKVLCVLESRESDERGGQDDLLIVSLTSTETLKSGFFIVPPSWMPTQTRTLALASSLGGDIHPTPSPCPLYHFFVSVNEEEYEAIKELPVTTRFGFSLQMFDGGA